MSSILKALQKLDRETAKQRPQDDPHGALRRLVPRKMAGRSRGLMLRNTAFGVFAFVFLGAVSWAIWRHPFWTPRSAVPVPPRSAETGLQPPRSDAPVRPLPEAQLPSAIPPIPSEARPVSPPPARAPEVRPPAPPSPAREQPPKPSATAVAPEPSLPETLPAAPLPPAAGSAGMGRPPADAGSRLAPVPPRQLARPTVPPPPVRTPSASLQPPAPAPPRPAATARSPQRPAPSAAGHREIPVKSQDESGLTIQALVWSTAPEERLVVVNGTILKEGGIIDGMSVASIGEDHIIVNQGGSRWKVKFQLK